MRIRTRLPALAAAVLAAACAAHRPDATAAAPGGGGRCAGHPYVEVENPLPDRAYLQLVTASGREFFVDDPLKPKETRRIATPRNEQVVRAYASTEAWRVERPGRPATYRSTGTRVAIQTGCAAT
jgi:hypothetical protein